MITLHHLNNSRSQRIIWLLEELGMDYQVQRHERDPQTMLAPESLKAVHPLGKSPVIVDEGVTIAESGAIIEYLVNKDEQRRLVPEYGTPEQREYTFWLHYGEGSLMPPMVMRLVFEKIRTSPMPFFVRPVAKGIVEKTYKTFLTPMLRTHLNFVEEHLSRNTWMTGDRMSGADIQMSFPLEASVARGIVEESRYPHIHDYVKRFHELPAYQRALKAGGEYDFA